MRNKFVYSCSIKIRTSGFNTLLESIFCTLLVVEAFSLPKVVEMLEEVVISWQEVRWMWQMRQNFAAQFVQLLKHWSWDIWSGVVVGKNWAISVDQSWLLALQFLVHLIDFLSMLLRCNGIAGIQKSCAGSDGQQATSDHAVFWCKFGFGKCFGASSQSSHWVGHCQLS